jgi:hypothetical protein
MKHKLNPEKVIAKLLQTQHSCSYRMTSEGKALPYIYKGIIGNISKNVYGNSIVEIANSCDATLLCNVFNIKNTGKSWGGC